MHIQSRGYTYRAEDTQRIHIQSRGNTEDTHTEQRIHIGYTYSTEQKIHRGYTYRAEDTQRIHTLYKADDSIHCRGCIFREDTQYTYRAETTNT
jgi:hypothetical protein